MAEKGQPLLVPLHSAEAPQPALPSSCPAPPRAWSQWILPGTSALLAFSVFYLDERWDEVEGGGRVGLSRPLPALEPGGPVQPLEGKIKWGSGKSEKVGCSEGQEPAGGLLQGGG